MDLRLRRVQKCSWCFPYGGGVGNRQIENGDKFPYGGGLVQPSASACSTAVQSARLREEIWTEGGDRVSNKAALVVQDFRRVRDDNSYDVHRQLLIYESPS